MTEGSIPQVLAGEAGDYRAFLDSKLVASQPAGFDAKRLRGQLFDFQADLVRWALRRGRAAIFASTGLGKTRTQVEWVRQVCAHTGKPGLILAPLAVAAQTVAEARLVGVEVEHSRDGAFGAGITITNYERLYRFDTSTFGAVVLDESSCIKHHDTKTLKQLMERFASTPFRLCATATPAPNDFTELGTHAEFLGICKREEMLAEFFCHDGGETAVWRLKGHAAGQFWRWVASWGALVRTPADLGYKDAGYKLPDLVTRQHVIGVDSADIFAAGELFPKEVQSMSERRSARRSSIGDRVAAAAAIVNDSDEPWVVWCDLNDESKSLAIAITDAVEVTGSDDIDLKEQRLMDFAAGKIRVLVTKPSIAGFGLNWQHCARMAFVGVTDSWEAYFQAVRRCWRFGQKRHVEVHVFVSEMEGAVTRNLERKAIDAEEMGRQLSAETSAAVLCEVRGTNRLTVATDHRMKTELPQWLFTKEG